MKAQMKSADRLNAKTVIVIGEDEVEEHVVMLRNMADRSQEKVSLYEISPKVKVLVFKA